MKMERRTPANAVGCILAHSFRQNGLVIGKGTALTEQQVVRFQNLGVEEITVAVLEPEDIDENSAAEMLAQALCGSGLRFSRAFSGRCQLRAIHTGLLRLSVEVITKLNQNGWELTIATGTPGSMVKKNDLIASVKVIPYGVSKERLQDTLSFTEPMSVDPFKPHKAGILLTRHDGTDPGWTERALSAQRQRLRLLGGHLEQIERCAHTPSEVRLALKRLIAAKCHPILVLGASAIADVDDVLPRGLELAGGAVTHVGMPVDPGNLLMVGKIDETSVIGVPGCARSLNDNGFDRILREVLCGAEVTAKMIQSLGVGGLLNPAAASVGQANLNHAAILLMAGRSKRMGSVNKLLLPIGENDTPMAKQVAERVINAGYHPVVAVVAQDAEDLRECLVGLDLQIVENPEPNRGMSSSLHLGLSELGSPDGTLVVLGDMPYVSVSTYRKIRDLANSHPDEVVAPVHNGQRGNPVLFPSTLFKRLLNCSGDRGARDLLNQLGYRALAVMDDSVLRDVDRPEDVREQDPTTRLRGQCPALHHEINGHPLIYFDHAATTPTPRMVLDAMRHAHDKLNANVGRSVHSTAANATAAIESARNKCAQFLNADPRGLIFTSGTTESLNGLASMLDSEISKDAIILIDPDAHHSMLLPIRALAERTGALLQPIPITTGGTIDLGATRLILAEGNVAIMAVSTISNVMGRLQPVSGIAAFCKAYETRLIVDASQAVAHDRTDIKVLGADALVFGAHKMFGPMGSGVLWVKPDWLNVLKPWKLGGGSVLDLTSDSMNLREMPHCFEAGTPNLPGILGLDAAISWLNNIGWDFIETKEAELTHFLRQKLGDIDKVNLLSPSPDIPLFSFTLDGVHPHDVGTLLDEAGFATRTGQHCSSTTHERLGVDASVRVSLSFLNTTSECTAFVERLRAILQIFNG